MKPVNAFLSVLLLGATLALIPGAVSSAEAEEIRNGYILPTRSVYRVLVVFAEIDYTQGSCPQNLGPPHEGSWDGQVPPWAGDLFDPEKLPAASAFLTDLYRQASFGAYDLLGDFYPKVFTIPCDEIRGGTNHRPVLKRLAAEPSVGATLLTASGLPLSAFDLWSLGLSGHGQPKVLGPDGRIDSVYILWRNNRFMTKNDEGVYSTKCNSGLAVHSLSVARTIHDMQGVETLASYNACDFPLGITAKEHMHGLFGGNQWHSGGGAGTHATFAIPAVYGLTAQSQTMLTVNAWDRWMLEWEHPNKNPADEVLISVGDQTTGEVPSDISIESHPVGASFVLRDFLTTGDAVRVKLPHLEWQQPGDKQNQYLWLENRRMKSRLEDYYVASKVCSDRGGFATGTPGIYAYVQVGKDRKEGSDLFGGGDYANPNFPASWIFPLTAEGNYDFAYRLDLEQAKLNAPCNWGNANIPIDRAASLPNPFTGLSDLNGRVDSNEDGILGKGDLGTGLSEVINGKVVHNFPVGGDWEDAFGPATGKTELSLSTNPAPVPVYTHRHPGTVADSDNRVIWLNGLSITLQEAPGSPEDVLVTIRWDDYTVEGAVRWTGNIHLSPNDFDPRQPSLVLVPGASLFLDRGLSPTYPVARDGYFSDPTLFTALPGSHIRLEQGSELVVMAESELRLVAGSRLVVSAGARIELSAGGRLVVENGAELVVEGDGVIDVNATGELALANRTVGKGLTLSDPQSRVELAGILATLDGADLTFQGTGHLRFEPGNSVDVSPGGGVVLRGVGSTDLLASIDPQTVVSLEAVRTFLRDGRIEYGAGSRLEMIGNGGGVSQALVQRVRFHGGGGFASGALALHARSFRRVAIVQSEVKGLERGFVLTDMLPGFPSIVNDVTVEDCVLAVEAKDLTTLNITRLRTGISCLDGARFERVERVNLTRSEMDFHDVAIDLVDVGSLRVAGGHIGDNLTGIRALRSDVFVRNGAVIENNFTGIESLGEPGALTRVTVGDSGCETAIVNNHTGIRGKDVELALDALEHACANGACSTIRPNRFDSNGRLVSVCYTDPPAWNTIGARANYWGGGPAPTTAIQVLASCTKPGGFLDFDAGLFFPTAPAGCTLGGPPVVDGFPNRPERPTTAF